jgi:hypothetical protein
MIVGTLWQTLGVTVCWPARVWRHKQARTSAISRGMSSGISPRGALALSVRSTMAPVAKGYSNARDVIAAGMAHTTAPASDATNCNITSENRWNPPQL